MAARSGGASYDQLHHFVSSGVWDAAPLETALLTEADAQIGGDDAWLIIDDTSLPKKGTHSVGVAPQYASTLGKTSNCQTLVSLTLARREVPVMIGLRLFLPEIWTSDLARLDRAKVPEARRDYRTKPEIALEEIDRARQADVRFGCVLADAGYGLSAPFRQGLFRLNFCLNFNRNFHFNDHHDFHNIKGDIFSNIKDDIFIDIKREICHNIYGDKNVVRNGIYSDGKSG
jgi:SRSO17 transposase